MKELSDEEMQNVDGGASFIEYLNTTKWKHNHYFYPTKSLVKQADGIYTYDQTKGQRTLLNNKGKLRIILTVYKHIKFRKNGKIHTMVYCQLQNLGGGYINCNVQRDGSIEDKKGNTYFVL